MIIRQGISVKYTHDDEAMLTWLLGLREFAGVEPSTVWAWLNERSRFACCADYWVLDFDLAENGGHATFQSCQKPLYGLQGMRDHLLKITLWDADATARFFLERYGYSCVICAARCNWGDAVAFLHGHRAFDDAVHDRQTVRAPMLACAPCQLMLEAISGSRGWKQIPVEDHVEKLLSRIQPELCA